MTRPLSVIMTVYNGAAYLPAAVSSLLKQTFSDFELVVVDDGSTDNSLEILRSFDDPRIRIIQLAQNIGRTPALNVALNATTTEYVAVLDADDVAFPQRLERQMAYLTAHPPVALLGTWYQIIDDVGNVRASRSSPTDQQALIDAFATHNPFGHSTVLYRRACALEVGGYPVAYAYGEDRMLCLRISTRAPVAMLPEELVQVRRHASNMSSKMKLTRERDSLWSVQEAYHHPRMSAAACRRAYHAITVLLLRHAAHCATAGLQQEGWRWLLAGVIRDPYRIFVDKQAGKSFLRCIWEMSRATGAQRKVAD